MAGLTALQNQVKLTVGRLVIDSAEEILANKLCTLLSRIEARDLVDVARLEESGLNPLAALEQASRKDAGVTPAQLAWVLSTFPVSIDEESNLGMSRSELEEYRDTLVRRLTAEAFPKGSAPSPT